MSVPNYPLGQGFRPYLLRQLANIVGEGNLPQHKIEHVGFMNFLQSQNKPEILRLNNTAGHLQAVQVKYLQRLTEEFTGTNEGDVCSHAYFEPYHEATANLTSFRFVPLYLGDEIVAQYEDDASRTLSVGAPPTMIMNEMLERIMTAANAIIGGVRTDLLTSLTIGNNRVTGNATAQTINFELDTNLLPLNDGMTKILTDYSINLGSGKPEIVGSGLIHNFFLQQVAKGVAQSGLNTAIEAAECKFYYDQKANDILGANQFVVIEPNTVQIVEYMQYTGFKAGAKPGSSIFGTLALPMQVGQDVLPIEFDYQLKYVECPTEYINQYYGNTMLLQKGWTCILSKKCGIFQIPADAYNGIDPMLGVNGVFRYTSTNNA